ncbi:MAG: hypothetical protein MUC29_02525 [Pyrinomonadaceae bacterium]|nr:hypothetical protein [Pyrinomonadaceae bacterium]
MEFQTATKQRPIQNDANFFDDENDVNQRLEQLLKINAETERKKSLFRNDLEEFEAELIKKPITTQKAFQLFGALLGTFPPMTLFGMFLAKSNVNYSTDFWIIPLLLLVNCVCALTGYFSGKLIGKMVAETEKWNWGYMLLVLPFIGIFWGIMTGGAGGVFIFVIGAFFGAIIASAVGSVGVTTFTLLHRWLKKGDVIESNKFIPIAVGITATICALFLGLNIK